MLFALALAAAITRVELPIAEVVLSDGTRRYTVPLTVAGRPVTAGLDTGSVGLRLLPAAAAGTTATGQPEHYSYGVGTQLDGVVARASVAMGDLAADIRVQAVRTIGCTAARPDCPARHIPPARFGIQGNGLPGEGFAAILGTAMVRAALPNPLVALGARRWIVELPRPGTGQPGRLILNPGDDEVAGFVPVPLADPSAERRTDAVAACLVADGGDPVCAPTLIDSGAPGIEVVNRTAKGWTGATQARLAFGPATAPVATVDFPLNSRAAASHLDFVRDGRVEGARIRSGLVAYLADDVLYDTAPASIAVRPRPPYAGGAVAR
jgi:hypothetical protein